MCERVCVRESVCKRECVRESGSVFVLEGQCKKDMDRKLIKD